MAVFPVAKLEKDSNYLIATTSSYSEEYAERMCSLYLTDHIDKDESGNLRKRYRLHAQKPHSDEMAFAYSVNCPRCNATLKQVGSQLTSKELGLYECKVCNKK